MKTAGAFANGLRCVRCRRTSEIGDDVYVCASCGGNVLVQYDLEAARRVLTCASLEGNTDRTLWRYLPVLPVSQRLQGPPHQRLGRSRFL